MKTKLIQTDSLLFSIFLVFAGLLGPSLKTHAAVIQGVTINAVSTSFANRGPTNLVSDSGVFGDFHTALPNGYMWVSASGTIVANQFVTFDLGSVHTINRMKVWNYNETAAPLTHGIQSASIATAGPDLVFTTNFATVVLNQGAGVFSNFSQTIDFGGISARYVRINPIANFAPATDKFAGLSEVQFIDDTVPPTIRSASQSFGNERVTLHFAEPVSVTTATNIANYSVFSGTNVASILGVSVDIFGTSVELQTSILDSNLVYSVSAQNVKDAANIISITNTTLPVEKELALWLSADSGVITNENGLVTQWNDHSGNGNNAAQGNSLFMPSLVPNVVNGLPVLRFNGSTNSPATNYLDIPHNSSLVAQQDMSYYAVVRAEDFAVPRGILSKAVANQPAPFDIFIGQTAVTNGQTKFVRGNGLSSVTMSGTTKALSAGSSVTNFYLISGSIKGTNGVTYLNGALNGNGAMVAGAFDAGGVTRVGARADFATRFNGDIAEIVFIRGSLSLNERSNMDVYLGNKYGIPLISLEFTLHPIDIQKLEGQTATFTSKAVANSPQLTYQWQKNGTNILDATNANYTTPILTLADNNNTYRVQAFIPGSSQFSQTATLTVSPDQEKPTIVSAGIPVWNQAQVVVNFSESVDALTGTDAANYSLDNGAIVTAATFGSSSNQIALTIDNFMNGISYSLSVQNVKDLFSNTMDSVLVPVGIIPAGLRLWLKADSGVTADESGFVSFWSDVSGNANDAFQPGDQSNMPTLVSNIFNGKPALRFDGAANYLVCQPTASLGISGDLTIYAVASFVDFANYNEIVGKTTANKPAPFDFYMNTGNGIPRFYRGDGNLNFTSVNGTTSPIPGVPHVVYVTQKGTAVSHFMDGNANGTGTLSTTIVDDPTAPLGIGTRSDFLTRMKGDIAEILIFGASLSAADRGSVDAYLGLKYGVAIGTPETVRLSATRAGNSITLSWPTPVGVFVLEETSSLGGTWTTVADSVTSSGGTNSVTLTVSGAQKFYRLRH